MRRATVSGLHLREKLEKQGDMSRTEYSLLHPLKPKGVGLALQRAGTSYL